MAAEKRRELDPKFKQVVTQFLAPLPVTVQTEVEVSRLPRTIDVLVLVESAEAHIQLRAKTPFHHFRTHNQIEFKGQNDRLTLWNFLQILGRAYFYIGENKIPLEEMSVTIISAGRPRKLLESKLSPHTFEALGDGWYRRDGFPSVTLIVINELPVTVENYPLLLFASSERKFRTLFQHIVAEDQNDYLFFAYQVRPHLTKELLIMSGKVYSLPRKNLEFIAQDIGADLIEFIPPEIRLRGMSLEERLAGVSSKEQLAGISPEERLAGISPEERLAGISPEERLAGISPEERLAGISPEERLAGISPEERLAGVSPEERLAGVKPEQIVEIISHEDLRVLMEEVAAKAREQMLRQTNHATDRIAALMAMSAADRKYLLDEANRDELLAGLDEAERVALLRWVDKQ